METLEKEICHCDCCSKIGGEVVCNISNAQALLAVVRGMFRDENLMEIKDKEFEGVKKIIEAVNKELEEAITVYCSNH